MGNFKATSSFLGIEFLNQIKSNEFNLKFRNSKIKLIRQEASTNIITLLTEDTESDAEKLFTEILDFIKPIITFCTRTPIRFNSISIVNLDKKTASNSIGCEAIIRVPFSLPDVQAVVNSIVLLEQSVHLENALHYYHLAILSDDSKDKVLNLYKVVESIIGYPGGNDGKFKNSLTILGIADLLVELKYLRKLRNSYDAGHSAGGEKNGNISYKLIKISSKDINKGIANIQKLILATIKYLTEGNKVCDIFISK